MAEVIPRQLVEALQALILSLPRHLQVTGDSSPQHCLLLHSWLTSREGLEVAAVLTRQL